MLLRTLCLCLTAALSANGQAKLNTLPQERLGRALERVERDNAKRFLVLKSMFTEAGCAEGLREEPVKREKEPNLTCTIKGDQERTVFVLAHFDRAGGGEGAADNWTGAAMLPLLYESLSQIPRRLSYVFVGTTAEEKGLNGAKDFARRFAFGDAKVRAVVNLDTLGLSATKVWVNHSSRELMEDVVKVAAALRLEINGMNADKVAMSDILPFLEKGVPTIDFNSVNGDNLQILHTAKDVRSAVDLNHYYNAYRIISVFLAYLDAREAPPQP